MGCTYDEAGTHNCPGDGLCVDDGDGLNELGQIEGYCLDGCETDEDCREGYACEERGLGGERACVTACTDDSVCTSGRECVEPWGSCYPPFDDAEFGQPCNFDYACETGFCFNEQTYGYPEGMCIAIGCSSDDECPPAGVCIISDEEEGTGNCYPGCLDDS